MPGPDWQLQVPATLTVAVHRVNPPSLTVTVPSGSAVPLITGRLLEVVVPLMGEAKTGATGGTVSTVTVTGLETSGPTWATNGVLPFDSVTVTGQVQVPFAATVVLQTTVPVGCVVTVKGVFGVPVPINVGVVVLTGVPADGLVITGGVVSTLNGRTAGWLVLPAGSVDTTVTEFAPGGSGVVVQLQAPFGEAVVAHSTLPSGSLTVTVLLGSAVPDITGVLVPTVAPEAGMPMKGAGGGTLSTVIGTGVPEGLVLPAGSVAVVPSVCGPLLRGVVGLQLQVPPVNTVVAQSSVPVG